MSSATSFSARVRRQLELQRSRREAERTLRHLYRTVGSPAQIDEILARMETPARVWRKVPVHTAVVTDITPKSLPLAA
ncbi:hypothetical protein [Naasia sp. SYSU D00948]|uniref:hypothetical protein n=1 Tax=Naasia sp. SYSU D00948 TaxID=2817379 RepID=UPI001B30F6AE|nr:hypothetical protein [Naasia sp. SYSU D00948]